jgi:hypothetical protein
MAWRIAIQRAFFARRLQVVPSIACASALTMRLAMLPAQLGWVRVPEAAVPSLSETRHPAETRSFK